MSARPEVVVLPDPAAVATAAADRIVSATGAGQGPFSMALSGGSTPKQAYGLLATRSDIDWSRIDLYFGDERCVPPEDPDSNFRMATAALLVPLAAAGHSPRTIARMEGEADPDAAAARYAERIAALPSTRIDLVLLGMGPDGHTASLFPGSPVLSSKALVAATEPHLGHRRITLTYATLNAAARVLVLVTGAEKHGALELALDGPPGAVPLRDVRPRDGVMTLLCDRAAFYGA